MPDEIDNTLPERPEIKPPTEPEIPPTGEEEPDHNVLGEPEGYTPIGGPVYQGKPVQFEEASKSGEPQPHEPGPEELPTTNAHEDGGLPTNPREPYPTGAGPQDAGKIKGVSDGTV